MNNVAENLERHYQGFVRQSNEGQFFLGLADYVQQILETAETRPLIEKLCQQREEDHKPMLECEARVLKETEEAAQRLFAEITKHGISDSELDEQIACYARRGQEFIWGSPLAAHLFEILGNVVRRLCRLGHVELVKNYISENEHFPGEIVGFTFSKSMDLKGKARQILEEKTQNARWHSWDCLRLAHFTIFESLERVHELEKIYKDNKAVGEGLNLVGCREEMKEIRSGKVSSEETMFPKSKYLGHATRIHNYLMANIEPGSLVEKSSSVSLLAPESSVGSPRYVLRKGLGFWTLVFDGQSAQLKHERGIFYVSHLLKNPPQTPIYALDLVQQIPAIYRKQLGITSTTNEDTGEVVTLEGNSRIQERSTGLDDRKSLRAIRNKKRECEATLEDPNTTEPEKLEAHRELEEIDEFQRKHFRPLKSNVGNLVRAVRRAITRFHDQLSKAKREDGQPDPTCRAFADHLYKYLLIPSARYSQPKAYARIRKGVNVREGLSGCFTYEPPSGLTWVD